MLELIVSDSAADKIAISVASMFAYKYTKPSHEIDLTLNPDPA